MKENVSLSKYVIGFLLSIVLTIVAFGLVMAQLLSGMVLYVVLLGIAAVQVYVQMRCFIHLNDGPDRVWSRMAFIFMAVVVIIIVVGSLWIMTNLSYNMTPNDMDAYMKTQVNKGF